MKPKALVLTVGGSDVPLVTSINDGKKLNVPYSKYIFLASEGTQQYVNGKDLVNVDYQNKDKKRPSIVVQTQLTEEQYDLHIIDEIDTPYSCYAEMKKHISDYYDKYDLSFDYTGGTKTMSACLFVVAIENPNNTLVVVKGRRDNTDKVRHDSYVEQFRENLIYPQRNAELIKQYIADQNYNAAHKLIYKRGASAAFSNDKQYQQLRNLISIFKNWNEFQYKEAAKEMESYFALSKGGNIDPALVNYKINIEAIKKGVEELAKDLRETTVDKKEASYAIYIVYDVIFNARRRAQAGYYDDAVGRLYRALELYGQLSLLYYNVKSSDITEDVLQKITEERRDYYIKKRNDKGKIQIGLRDDFLLLNDLENSVGKKWMEIDYKMIDLLSIRNHSLFAHGLEAISEEEYTEFYDTVASFITETESINPILKGLCDGKKPRINLATYLDLPCKL